VIPYDKYVNYLFDLFQELKDTVTKIMSTDIKQKLFDSVSATINAVYSIAVGNSYDASAKSVEQVFISFITKLKTYL
jgi:hypothetical protein